MNDHIQLAKITDASRENGMRLFGVAQMAPLRQRFGEFLLDVDSAMTHVVVMGMPLQTAVLDTIHGQPNLLYFHHYKQANYQLDRAALAIADIIQDMGFRALAIPASQIVHREPMLGHLPHKLMGYFAGLGWIGRNNLLVNPQYGSAVRYVTVLTDLELPAGKPIDDDCGSCRACVSKCPAKAIGESFKEFNLDACYRQLCDFVKEHVVGQHVCGVCVSACRGKV